MGLPALRAESDFSGPQPAWLAVQWISGRIDLHPMHFPLVLARRLARDWSDSSASIERVWLEDASGALLYVAIDGHGLPRKAAESPMR